MDQMVVLNSPRIPVASVTMTRALKQEESKGGAAASAEPEAGDEAAAESNS